MENSGTLNSLARSAASDMDFENGRLKLKVIFLYKAKSKKNQALQWF